MYSLYRTIMIHESTILFYLLQMDAIAISVMKPFHNPSFRRLHQINQECIKISVSCRSFSHVYVEQMACQPRHLHSTCDCPTVPQFPVCISPKYLALAGSSMVRLEIFLYPQRRVDILQNFGSKCGKIATLGQPMWTMYVYKYIYVYSVSF